MSRSGTPLDPRSEGFYARSVHEVARDSVGCRLHHAGQIGRIAEVEAYHQEEPACHAFAGLTPRTRTLFGPPGVAYVYRSYGIHALFNLVCEEEGIGAAVLVRALEPLTGLDAMRTSRRRSAVGELCSGPGKLTEALGITLDLNGTSLIGGPIEILPPDPAEPPVELVRGPRIGITKAVDLPWRFCDRASAYVSRPWPGGMTPHRQPSR